MFSKDDFIQYFKQIAFIERDMLKAFTSVAKDIKDPYLKVSFEELIREEAEHSLAIIQIEKIIEKSNN